MREILLRGKRIDNGEWVQGFLAIWGDDYYIAPDINIYTSMGGRGKGRFKSFGRYYQVIPSTVGQYTGLTDKNDKKIFEGDIIFDLELKENCIVEFDEGSFYAGNIFSQEYISFYEFRCEVIGNIHDNPELLEGQS